MYRILVVSHSILCKGVIEGAKMILGDVSGVDYVSLDESGIEKFSDRLNSKLAEIKSECKDILVLADLFGGTPFNKALMESMNDPEIKIITGVNLPMLMEAVMNNEGELQNVYDSIVEAGTSGIRTNNVEECNLDDE